MTATHDDGGQLEPGFTLVENRTGRPEAILTTQQWETLTGRSVDELPTSEEIEDD